MIPIGKCVGQEIKCPECGRPALVSPGRQRHERPLGPWTEHGVSSGWVLVDCKQSGKKLYEWHHPAETIEAVHG